MNILRTFGFLSLLVAGTLSPGAAVRSAGAQQVAPSPPSYSWRNAALDSDTRADLLIAEMSQDEQLQMVIGYVGADKKLAYGRPAPEALKPYLPGTAGYVPGNPRLGIPSLIETDAGLGIANNGHLRPLDQATALPSGLLTAATWDQQAAEQAGSILGSEARARGFNVVLGGAVNLAREPRGGRTFEYAGEDPLLAGSIVGAEIRGVQGQHVISTMKHFALNDQESGRTVLNAVIGESAARESDLLAFQIALQGGNPGAVMCAYNRLNGPYACENPFLLTTALKQQWRFPGWVLSDWGAVHSTVESANAGLDQESAAGFDRSDFFGAPLKTALSDGSVVPARLHDMVHRILRTMFANGLFDVPPVRQVADTESHLAIAQKTAEEGIVLLKNDGSLLPLLKTVRSIAVIGAHADIGVLSGGGSSQVIPIGDSPTNEIPVGETSQSLRNGAKIAPTGNEIFDPPSPLAEIRALAPAANVSFDSGEDADLAANFARQSDVAVVFASQWMGEGRDVQSLALPGNQDTLIAAVAAANPRTIVVLETGGPVLMPWLLQVPSVIEAWYAGSGGARALARVLFGEVNPSGKLPITFPQADEQLPRPQITNAAPGLPFDVTYDEGADVGYRWFEQKNLVPLFPFGHGLSYSTFRISGLSVTPTAAGLSATVDVTNTSQIAGMETVQLYAAPPEDRGRGVKRLVGWSKVALKAGETRQIRIDAEPHLLARFDDSKSIWRITRGDCVVTAGDSSAAIADTAIVRLAGREFSP